MASKKEIFTGVALISLFTGVIYYAWKHRDIQKEKAADTVLGDMLSELSKKVKDHGYTVVNSPVSHPGSKFITFNVKSGDDVVKVLVNDKSIVTLTTDPLTPPVVMEFKDGHLYKGKTLLADNNDMLEGILQVIENKDYK